MPSPTAPSASLLPSSSGTGQFIAHGVRQQQKQENFVGKQQRVDFDNVPEEDRLWVRILVKVGFLNYF